MPVVVVGGSGTGSRSGSCKPCLLLRESGFNLSSSSIGTASGNHTTQDQKEIPQNKCNELVCVLSGITITAGVGARRVIMIRSVRDVIAAVVVVVAVSVAVLVKLQKTMHRNECCGKQRRCKG